MPCDAPQARRTHASAGRRGARAERSPRKRRERRTWSKGASDRAERRTFQERAGRVRTCRAPLDVRSGSDARRERAGRVRHRATVRRTCGMRRTKSDRVLGKKRRNVPRTRPTGAIHVPSSACNRLDVRDGFAIRCRTLRARRLGSRAASNPVPHRAEQQPCQRATRGRTARTCKTRAVTGGFTSRGTLT